MPALSEAENARNAFQAALHCALLVAVAPTLLGARAKTKCYLSQLALTAL